MKNLYLKIKINFINPYKIALVIFILLANVTIGQTLKVLPNLNTTDDGYKVTQVNERAVSFNNELYYIYVKGNTHKLMRCDNDTSIEVVNPTGYMFFYPMIVSNNKLYVKAYNNSTSNYSWAKVENGVASIITNPTNTGSVYSNFNPISYHNKLHFLYFEGTTVQHRSYDGNTFDLITTPAGYTSQNQFVIFRDTLYNVCDKGNPNPATHLAKVVGVTKQIIANPDGDIGISYDQPNSFGILNDTLFFGYKSLSIKQLRLARYDGNTITLTKVSGNLTYDSGIRSPFISYNNKMYFNYASTGNNAGQGFNLNMARYEGDTIHVFKNFTATLPALSEPNIFQGKLLITSFGGNLNFYDGTNYTTVSYPATYQSSATTAENIIFNNELYYGIKEAGTFGKSLLCKYDGAISTAIPKPSSNDFGIQGEFILNNSGLTMSYYEKSVPNPNFMLPPTNVFRVGVIAVPCNVTPIAASLDACFGAKKYIVCQASGSGVSYQWKKNGVAIVGATNDTLTFNTIITNDAGNYRCIVNRLCGIDSTNNLTLTVNALPTISVNSGTICTSKSFTITPSGANTYTIQGGSASVTPLSNTSYTVVGTSTAGCVSANTATANITVNTTPTVSVNNGTICSGTNFIITPSGASTYTFGGGNATVSPTSNTSYTVIGKSALGCISANTATSSVTVNTTPTVSVNSGAICIGANFTIVPSGASTYTYSNGNSVVSPTITTSYSVTGTSVKGCVSSNTAISTVTVDSFPIIFVTNGVICSGANYTLTPSGASTYTYSGGSAVVSPTTTSSYSITGTSSAGCISTNTAISTVTVNALPTINVNSGLICLGNFFILNPMGASTYTYSSGSNSVSPTTTSTFTVIGTDANGCVSSNTAISNVTVTSVTSSINKVNATCNGAPNGSATMFASNGKAPYNYVWTGTSSATQNANNLSAGNYTCVATDVNGCSATSTVSITEPTAIVLLPIADAILCNGAITQVTLTATGGVSPYNGVGTYSMQAGTKLFTVSDANGCLKTTTVVVTEPAAITKTNLYNLCIGQSVIVGSNTYTSTGIYTNTFTSAYGCDSTIITDLTVYNSINITTQLNGITITANQANATYQWINCSNNNSVIAGANAQSFSAIANGNYAVVINIGICSDTSACVPINSVGINEQVLVNNTKFYPNPSYGMLTIELGLEPTKAVQMVAVNALGQIIFEADLSQKTTTLNIQHLASGVYFIKLNNQIVPSKLIKN